ncbi:hypothetical protein RH831_11765 [Halodesulfurarchaeum sp. HSR-GB]|uniref:hypothetical protein n=1 Tax=Halodesulfurarchaeum sp. HSR-GB TaxID=3074077 RepID=UPI002861266A|nr:hypothetical protein [Halodesulfurarchaeum sp. HSR-GB]MDR5657848.1 hypothetical protein [Halodesulfurarchaeum sp. HSR-GB]
MAPSTVETSHLFPMRVIDSDFNVIKQNSDMTELTGIDTNSQEVNCHDQLPNLLCETEGCPLKRFRDDDGKGPKLRYGEEEVELRYVDEDTIATEFEVEMPNGETRFMSMVSERIMDKSGEPGAIIQSFKDMGFIKQSQDTNPGMSVPEPRDFGSFRHALTDLMDRAASNGVEVADRSDKSSLTGSGGQWKFEITPL